MKKIASIICVIGLIGILISMFLNGTFFFSNQKVVTVDDKIAVEVENATALVVISSWADVRVLESKDDQIHIRLHGDFFENEEMEIVRKRTGKEITIEAKGNNVQSSIVIPGFIGNRKKANTDNRKLDIYIPKDKLDTLNVETNLGSIEVNELDIKEVSIHADMGAIEVHHLITDQLTVQADVGEITLNEVTGNIHAQSDVGSIELALSKKMKDASFELRSDLGAVSLDAADITTEKSNGTIIDKIGSGAYVVNLSTDVGSIIVRD